MSTASQNVLSNRSLLIKWAVTIMVPLLVCLIPLNDMYTQTMRLYFVSTLFVIFLFQRIAFASAVRSAGRRAFCSCLFALDAVNGFHGTGRFFDGQYLFGLWCAGTHGLLDRAQMRRFVYEGDHRTLPSLSGDLLADLWQWRGHRHRFLLCAVQGAAL